MARHRTTLTAQERRHSALRWVGRAALWLGLGIVVGLAAVGALTWAGSLPGIRLWVGVAAGALAAGAAAVASTVPGPGASDESVDGPSTS